jgi:hypothetical protein
MNFFRSFTAPLGRLLTAFAAMALASGCAGMQDVSIMDMGAGTEAEDNAMAINQAIELCHEQGGGRVVVPKGRFQTGSLILKAGVCLYLEEGAVLAASRELAAYASYETDKDMSRYDSGKGTANSNCVSDKNWCRALILSVKADGSSIKGKGLIDLGALRDPHGEEGLRGPHGIIVAETRNFKMSGVRIKDASNYAILGYELEDCCFKNLDIEGGWDGIHMRGGRNILISYCCFATGDDCLAGGYWKGLTVKGCDFNSSCNGIRMIMPSEGFTVRNCNFHGPGRRPHITSSERAAREGGVYVPSMLHAIVIEPGAWGPAPGRLDGIRIEDSRAEGVLSPFCLTLGEDNTCGKLIISGYKATGASPLALSAKSWGTSRIGSVVIRKSSFSFAGDPEEGLSAKILSLPYDRWPVFPSYGAYFRNVDSVLLDRVTFTALTPDSRPDILTDSVRVFRRRR